MYFSILFRIIDALLLLVVPIGVGLMFLYLKYEQHEKLVQYAFIWRMLHNVQT